MMSMPLLLLPWQRYHSRCPLEGLPLTKYSGLPHSRQNVTPTVGEMEPFCFLYLTEVTASDNFAHSSCSVPVPDGSTLTDPSSAQVKQKIGG